MDKGDIKVNMRVRVEFDSSAQYKIDLPDWALARRRNHAVGTVVSPIAESGRDAWWIQLDPPKGSQRSLRRPLPEDPDAAVKDIVSSRYFKAPYISAEIHPITP